MPHTHKSFFVHKTLHFCVELFEIQNVLLRLVISRLHCTAAVHLLVLGQKFFLSSITQLAFDLYFSLTILPSVKTSARVIYKSLE